jgi:hypothetical protein
MPVALQRSDRHRPRAPEGLYGKKPRLRNVWPCRGIYGALSVTDEVYKLWNGDRAHLLMPRRVAEQIAAAERMDQPKAITLRRGRGIWASAAVTGQTSGDKDAGAGIPT